MAFLTSTNVTWRKEHLVIFVNLFLIFSYNNRSVMELQNDAVIDITIIGQTFDITWPFKRFKEGTVFEK